MPAVFVSYRRTDAAGSAGRLFERLSQRFGSAQVFRDIESIEAGEDFEESIRDALRTATAVLVVIGPHWLDLRMPDGTRRLDDAGDYVRREVAASLASDAIVVPVLIENAAMPSAEALPAAISELAKRNAMELRDRSWEADVAHLLRQLEAHGIVGEPASAGENASEASLASRGALSTIVGFIPNFLSLLFQPRRFLARRTAGKGPNLIAAFTYFAVAVLIAIALLLSAYTPVQSVAGFGLTVVVLGLMITLTLSAPLWLAWRVVGARRHYGRLLVVLLHQSAVLHLFALVAVWIVLVGLDLRSRDVMRETIDAGLAPGTSFNAALDVIRSKLAPFADAPEVRLSFVLGAIVMLTAIVWAVASWGAYRDAFGLTRARSALAVAILAAIAWSMVALIGSV